MNEREHVVYGFFDHDDRLIYVGSTWNVGKRTKAHAATAWWFSQAVRREVLAVAGSKAGALRLESEAIREMRPRWNRAPMPPRIEWTASDYCDWILSRLAEELTLTRKPLGVRPDRHIRGVALEHVMEANARFGLDLPTISSLDAIEVVSRGVKHLSGELLAAISFATRVVVVSAIPETDAA